MPRLFTFLSVASCGNAGFCGYVMSQVYPECGFAIGLLTALGIIVHLKLMHDLEDQLNETAECPFKTED